MKILKKGCPVKHLSMESAPIEHTYIMRFEDHMAVKMSMVVFWVVTSCGLKMVTNISEKHVAPP
jgi:hypothetical protein